MTEQDKLRAVMGYKPGQPAREYEAGEIIPANTKLRGTEKGSDLPLPEDECTMGASAFADSEPVRRRDK